MDPKAREKAVCIPGRGAADYSCCELEGNRVVDSLEALVPLLIHFVNGATWGAGEGKEATCLEFLSLGGLFLARLSGCGKWKMKETAFPAYQVTMPKPETDEERGKGWIC